MLRASDIPLAVALTEGSRGVITHAKMLRERNATATPEGEHLRPVAEDRGRIMALYRVLAIAMISLAQGAMAGEVAYDFVACTHSKRTLLEASSELVALGFESWGVVASSTTKEWENASTHCVGYIRLAAGKPVGKGVCRWFDAAGDTAIGEFEYPPAGEPVWTWLSGTGKLKGITGKGTFKELFTAKTADDGTSQGCRRDWGRYTLP